MSGYRCGQEHLPASARAFLAAGSARELAKKGRNVTGAQLNPKAEPHGTRPKPLADVRERCKPRHSSLALSLSPAWPRIDSIMEVYTNLTMFMLKTCDPSVKYAALLVFGQQHSAWDLDAYEFRISTKHILE